MSATTPTDMKIWGGFAAGCVVVATLAVVTAAIAIWTGFVYQCLWNWFVAPLIDVSLTLPHAIGLAVLLALVRGGLNKKETQKETWGRFGAALLSTALLLTVGYFAHLAMVP